MFTTLFGNSAKTTETAVNGEAHLALESRDKQALMNILLSAAAVMPLSAADAEIVASYMQARHYAELEIMMEQGAKTRASYMLWVLEGEVTLEAVTPSTGETVTIKVLGAGGTLGAMGLTDGAAPTLQGVATSPTRCAVLSRLQLQKLCREHPTTGVKLMSVLCLVLSSTLRDLTGKFKAHVRLNNVLNEELRGRQSARPPL